MVPPNKWPEKDEVQLSKLWAEGMSVREIGEVMGRSESSIKGKVHRMKLTPRTLSRRPYDPEEEDLMCRLWWQNKSNREIAEIVGRNPSTVSGKMSKLRPWTKPEYREGGDKDGSK